MQSGSSVRGTGRQGINKLCQDLTRRAPVRSQGVILPKVAVSNKKSPVVVVVKRRRWTVASGKTKMQ